MAYTDQQVDQICDIIHDTCKEMTAQEVAWCQTEIRNLIKEKPEATKEDIIGTVFDTLKHNMMPRVAQRPMFQTYADPNVLYVEMSSTLSKALDEMTGGSV